MNEVPIDDKDKLIKKLENKLRTTENVLEHWRDKYDSLKEEVSRAKYSESLALQEVKNLIKQNDIILQHENRINEIISNVTKWMEARK